MALAAVVFFFRVPTSVKPAQASVAEKLLQMDILGALIYCGAIMCYLLALSWGGAVKSWGSSEVIGTLVGFGVLLIVFFIFERWQGERALLHPGTMRDRTIVSGSIFSFL